MTRLQTDVSQLIKRLQRYVIMWLATFAAVYITPKCVYLYPHYNINFVHM